MNDDHPLLLYIQSLSTALNNHQSQLHHHLLLTSSRTQSHLTHENSILKQELTTLRSQASTTPTESSIKINQLSLALRTLNEKLELTERLLLERTKRLNHASADVAAAKSSMDAAYDLVARVHAREEESLTRQRDLHMKLQLEEEKSRLNERVIQDYADLVRKLEGRPSSITTTPKSEQTAGEEFKSETTTQLQHPLSASQHDLSILQTKLDAQIKTNENLTSQLSQLQVELDKRERDDNTASKMVSRYMKFSQQSTNALQTTLTSLQSRHISTLTSYTSQIHLLQTQLQTLTTSHPNLDQLHYQLLKEAFGRRRETKLRLHLIGREERLVEDLKRWLRKSEERLILTNEDQNESNIIIIIMEMIQDAKIIIDNLDDPIHIDFNDSVQPISGSLARFVTIQSTVHDLLERLHYEQARRVELEELVARRDEKGTEDERIFSDTNNVLEEPTTRIPTSSSPTEEEKDDLLEEGWEFSAKEQNGGMATESIPERTDQRIEQARRVELEELVALRDGKGMEGERIFSDTSNVLKEPTTRIPTSSSPTEEEKDDLLEEGLEFSAKEQNGGMATESVTECADECIYPFSSSYTNDLLEESTPHTPSESESKSADIIVESEEGKENIVINVDTIKDGVDEESRDTDNGSSNQEIGNSQLDADVSSLPSLSLPNPPPSPDTKPPQQQQQQQHPLLKSLHQSRNRYTHIQNSFHDCHIALEKLKSHLTSSSKGIKKNNNIPYDILRIIVQRLDDYTEDTRVELEIRILDEEVLGRGYETLLMCSPSGGDGEEWNEEEILAFVNGTDPIIVKALKSFERKLRDLEEDVVVVKKSVYSFGDDDDDGDGDREEKSKKKMVSLSTPESLSTDTSVASPPQGWISSWISPSRSTTPIPHPPQLQQPTTSNLNLTFGDIMINRPRKPSSSSLSNLNSNSILRRTVSSLGLASSHHTHSETPSPPQKLRKSSMHSRMTPSEVIKILQLKTSMPDLLINETGYELEKQDDTGIAPKSGLISTFSGLGSTITATPRSNSFALGMGIIGRGGRGGRGGMLGRVGVDIGRRRRVVSAVGAAPTRIKAMGLEKVVDGDGFNKEDVD